MRRNGIICACVLFVVALLFVRPAFAMTAGEPTRQLLASPYMIGNNTSVALLEPRSLSIELADNHVEYVNSLAHGSPVAKTITVKVRNIAQQENLCEFTVPAENSQIYVYAFRTVNPKHRYYVLVVNDIKSQKCMTHFYLIGRQNKVHTILADTDALKNAGWSSQYIKVGVVDSQIAMTMFNGDFENKDSQASAGVLQFLWDDAAQNFNIQSL